MFQSALLKVLLAAALVAARSRHHPVKPSQNYGALYTMSNNAAGNSLIISSIQANGSVIYENSIPTGGNGLHDKTIFVPEKPDAVFAQGSVVVYGTHLYVVNPGSHTLSMFSINPQNALDLKMVGKPVSTGGEYPVSVDVDETTNTACVINGGRINGVMCFKVDFNTGLTPQGKFYSFGLNQTTPPMGPYGTVSQVVFSNDKKKLRASVKGVAHPRTPGFIATWDVGSDGTLSDDFTKTIPNPGQGLQPFGVLNVYGAQDALLVTDLAVGMTIYDFSQSTPALHPLVIDGQRDTCWVVYSNVTDSYWVSDLGTAQIYEVGIDNKSLEPSLLNTYDLAVNNNPIDVALATVNGKQYFYVLSPIVGIWNIFELEKNNSKLVQSYDYGTPATAKGLPLILKDVVGAAVFQPSA